MAVSAPRSKRPWYHPIRLLQRLVIYAVIGYVVLCVFLFALQNSLTYPREIIPTMQAVKTAKILGLAPWPSSPAPESLQGYTRIDFSKAAPRGTLVVFHGNGGAAYDRTAYIDACTQRGFRVLLYEYPGYGGRPGRPSEAAIVPDARAVVRSLDQQGFGPIYIWGESLGAGVAAAVCADPTLPVHGLVLLTPWDNIANVGLTLYPYIPVRLLMIDRYDSVANLQHFRHPICLIRSEDDEIIPPSLTLNLFAHLPDPKKMILQAGAGHNTWPDSPELKWWDDALDFIAPR